jgi:hypothetical protein
MQEKNTGLTKKQAKIVEITIVTFCVLSLMAIFQPFSILLYSIACVCVVIGGLMFNLVPLCREGVKPGQLVKIAIIIFTILVIAILLAIGSAYLYGIYLENTRPT